MLSKYEIIIGLLIVVIIGQFVYFDSKLDEEKKKTEVFMQENFTKGSNTASIQVKIKEETPEGQYNDSIYYTLEQWATKTPADIEADKKERVDNWLNIVRNSAPAIQPTKEELEAQANELKRQLDQINVLIEE